MRVKRYVAENLQEAMIKVKMDMGKDAVILHTKKFKEGGFFGFFGKVKFEVTAALEEILLPPAPIAITLEKSSIINEGNSSAIDRPDEVACIEEKAGLQEDIQEMKGMLADMMTQMDATQDIRELPKPFQKYHQILIDNEVDEKLTKKILRDILKQLNKEQTLDFDEVKNSLEQQILKLLKKPKPVSFKRMGLNKQLIALVGPTGVGKTTTIAKLAATFSIVDKKSVALITADTYRVAAVEQLKTYGEIIGIPVDVVYTPQELHDAISNHTDKDLILIDTAGRSHRNSEQMIELKSFFDVVDPSDIFLVLSATTRYKDMIEIINSYSDIVISRIVFTKLDETTSFGAILNIISKTQKCLSYVTVGQNVPDDIEIADPAKIAKNIMRER